MLQVRSTIHGIFLLVQSNTFKGVGLMLLGCGLLTANDALMKSLVSALPLGQVIFLRAITAFITVMLLMPWVGGVARLKMHRVSSVLLCGAMLVFNIVVFPYCLPYMNFADAIILAYTSPIWVVALAPLLIREKTRWQQWVAVLIGFVGAVFVIKPGGGSLHWVVAVPLVVALMVGLRDIVTRHIAARESALSIVACANFLSILAGAAMLPLGWTAPTSTQIWQLIAAGVFFTVAQMLMVESFRLMEATVLSTFKYSSILYAAAFGYLFWGEWLDLWAMLGAVFIVVSGIIILRYRHKPAPTLADVMPRVARSGD